MFDTPTHEQAKADLNTFKQALISSGKVSAIKSLRSLTGAGLKEAMDIVTYIFDAMDYTNSNAVIANPPCTLTPKVERVVLIEDAKVTDCWEYCGAEQDAIAQARDTIERFPGTRVQVARVIAEDKSVRVIETL